MEDQNTQNVSIIPTDILGATFSWFARISLRPTLKDRNVQLGVHFEEIAEMLAEMEGVDDEVATQIKQAHAAMHTLAQTFKHNSDECLVKIANRKLFLDSLCDQYVTVTGVAQRFEFGFVGACQETNRSNYSKFDDKGEPYRDQNGKVVKGPNYTPPDLTPYL